MTLLEKTFNAPEIEQPEPGVGIGQPEPDHIDQPSPSRIDEPGDPHIDMPDPGREIGTPSIAPEWNRPQTLASGNLGFTASAGPNDGEEEQPAVETDASQEDPAEDEEPVYINIPDPATGNGSF